MNPAEENAGIVQRMHDYFDRQIAWFEQMRKQLQGLEDGIEAEEAADLAEEDRERARVSQELHDEFSSLKKEWDGTDSIAQSDREDVQEIARRAEEIGSELQQTFERVAARAGTRADALREELGRLRQGKEQTGKYRPSARQEVNFVDRKA